MLPALVRIDAPSDEDPFEKINKVVVEAKKQFDNLKPKDFDALMRRIDLFRSLRDKVSKKYKMLIATNASLKMNANAVRARYETGATLYTSDAGIDASSDYNRQEEITARINYGQIICGILSLAKGGHLVTKQYTFLTLFSRSLIALLAALFDELYVELYVESSSTSYMS